MCNTQKTTKLMKMAPHIGGGVV